MRKITVDIVGENLELRSDAPEEEILSIVRYVDEKMREAIGEGHSTSREKAAVLAALNITEEFFKEKNAVNKQRKELEEKSNKLLELIESQLNKE